MGSSQHTVPPTARTSAMSSSRTRIHLVVFLIALQRCIGLSLPPSSFPDETSFRQGFLPTRRCLLGTVAAPVAWSFLSTESMAAEPIKSRDTDSLLAIAKRKFRPKPPKVLRRKLSQDFAVLLMRSSYSVLDELDCVAMDQFQRDFFLIRSSEYQDYTKALGSGMVQQGDLTDPYYFDFISFAQYQTINREITLDPPMVFQEMQPNGQDNEGKTNFVPVVVKRNPALTNALLAPTHSSRVGATVLDKLEETFRDTDLRLPSLGNRTNAASLLSALKKLVNLFLINGYAFRADVSMMPSDGTGGATGTKFVVNLQAPAILWSGTVLQMEKEPLSNDFLLKTMTELFKRSGYTITSSTKFDSTSEEIIVAIR